MSEHPHQHIIDQHRAAYHDAERGVRDSGPKKEPEPETDHCPHCGWSEQRCRKEIKASGTVCCPQCNHPARWGHPPRAT